MSRNRNKMLFLQKNRTMKYWYEKTSVKITLYLFLGLILFYFHTNYSFLRACAAPHFYKEYITAAISIIAVYLNFLFFFPRFYKQNRYKEYWILVSVTILLSSALEMMIVAKEVWALLEPRIGELTLKYFLIESFFVTLRNGGLVLFAYVVSVILWLRREEGEMLVDLRKKYGLVDVKDIDQEGTFINIKQVLYCVQDRNVTSLYLTDGSVFLRYNSMNNLEQILGSEEFLRISRSTIVQKKQIEQINGSNVVMREFANEKDKPVLSVDISYSEIVEQVAANKALTEEGQPEPIPEEKRKKNINQDFSLNQRAEDIYHYILSNPNSKIKDIANAFDISYRSVTRYLTFLKENGLIKYSGAKRNGGYKVVSRRRKIKKKQNRQSE